MPGFYTYEGSRRAFLRGLPGISDRVRKERWVLGRPGEEETLGDEYRSLGNDLLALYGRDFDAGWRSALSRLKMKRLNADKPQYRALGAATASNSPLKALFKSVVEETSLAKERKLRKEAPAKEGAAAPQIASSDISPAAATGRRARRSRSASSPSRFGWTARDRASRSTSCSPS